MSLSRRYNLMKKQIFTIKAIGLILSIFACASLLTSTLPAQEGRGSGRVRGVVYDTDKKPIEGVKLTLNYVTFSNSQVTTSDKKGKWIFYGLGYGEVKISAEKDGYIQNGIRFLVSGVQKNPKQFITLKKVTEVEPTENDANSAARSSFIKANTLFEERKFEEALALYRDFLQMQPKLYKVGINIANCYLEMGQYDEAIKEYQGILDKIVAENPEVSGNSEVAKIYASIGETYMRQNKLKEAEGYFKKSIEIDPSDHALAYNVAEILFAAGKTDDAITYYNLAIKIKPEWPKSYMQRGYAYLNKGDIPKAVESMKKYLELAPDSPEAEGIKEVINSLK